MHGDVIHDGEEVIVRAANQTWIMSWHAPPTPPDGTPHGAAGVCVTSEGTVVLIGNDGERWDLPAGRPEEGETWEQTLRREMREEACVTVKDARLLGFSRGECVEGAEKGLVLVRSVWRADVDVAPWEPEFEIAHRRLAAPAELHAEDGLGLEFAAIFRRALHEAGVLGP